MLTVEHRTYQALRRKLLSGELPSGARLSALAISKQMGISVTPVMQAIRRLESEGFVGLVPHFGACVRQPTIREIAELFDLRRALETFAVRRVARRASAEQVARLERTCDAWEQTIEPRRERPDDGRLIAASVEADLLFHMIIMDIAGSRRALKVFRDCHLLTRVFGSHTTTLPTNLGNEMRDIEQHRRIVGAIRERSPATAARETDRHLSDGRRRIVEHLRLLRRSDEHSPQSPAVSRAVVRALTKVENYQPGRV
jgi:DNA-binding GntR family transcriptional regulator